MIDVFRGLIELTAIIVLLFAGWAILQVIEVIRDEQVRLSYKSWTRDTAPRPEPIMSKADEQV